jgi:glycosyltransferase involved in cell wall biosynthesis
LLDQITPIILTYNEAANIRRTLEQLRWAKDIVVVDSFSDDATVEIVAQLPQARVFQRRFDTHEKQWNYALKETNIITDWVLALDADYVLTPEVVEEIKALSPDRAVSGYTSKFIYCVHGKRLRGSAYPPVTVLYRRERAAYRQDGHTQRLVIDGEVGELRFPLLHDDRKPLSHWIRSQDRYTQLELQHLREVDGLGIGVPDRLRKTRSLFPFVIFFYCLFVKGAILDGWPGIHYAFQRMLAEILLALYLIEEDLRKPRGQRSDVRGQGGKFKSQTSDLSEIDNQLSEAGSPRVKSET